MGVCYMLHDGLSSDTTGRIDGLLEAVLAPRGARDEAPAA